MLASRDIAAAQSAPKHNLPAQLTQFIGREHEVAVACTLYAQMYRDLDLAFVRDWDRRAHERLLVALAALPEARLQEPDWWTLGRAFDVNHDREHAQDIQHWLE